MAIPNKLQRIAARIWPVTILILTPLILAEAYNLWRKNRQQ